MVRQTSDLLQEALALHRRGAVAEAAARYSAMLQAEPHHADAHYYLGLIACQLGRFSDGAERARQALSGDPSQARAHVLLGRALAALGQHEEALASFDRALTMAPGLARAHGHRADLLSDLGRHAEAVEAYDRALATASDRAEDWFNRGTALAALGRHTEALASFERAIAGGGEGPRIHLGSARSLSELGQQEAALGALDRALAMAPSFAESWQGRGNVCLELKRYDDALSAFDKALALKPALAGAWLGRGNVLRDIARYGDAAAAYDKALTLDPRLAAAWLGRGSVLRDIGRHDDALAAYDKALALKPDLSNAWLGRGNVFVDLKRYEEAFAAYDKALALERDLAEAWLGRGNVFVDLKRYEEAFAAYDKALALKPDLAEGWLGRGNAFLDFQRYDDALAAYDKALALKPSLNIVAAPRMYAKLQLCDWTNLKAEAAELLSSGRERVAITPGPILAIASSPSDLLRCAKRYVKDLPRFAPLWLGEIYSHDRIRVAYLSADFRDHPVAHLTAGLFEQHDRSRFTVTGISFGSDYSSIRERIKAAFDCFIEVRDDTDQHVAEFIRRSEIDIAVDLMGHTQRNRLGLFARRPAPIQVGYLGFPGTTGADYIDYILADEKIIPKEHSRFYAEQVVWLPSYQVNDDKRQISDRMPCRAECGLPIDGFVFSCFNNSFKITPEIFDIWMRLLQAVEGSVLWLGGHSKTAVHNLCREAERRGVTPKRLVFAKRMPQTADHLARLRLADLFLDTLPYNAHTTASDALWGSLPVITCLGSTFPGRVAGSVLKSAGLDELVTASLGEYEALALKIARDPALLATIKAKIARNRDSCRLFDTARFTRDIEQAYATMVEIQRMGKSPCSFSVRP